MIVKLLFFSFSLAFSNAAVKLGCYSNPLPSFNNLCPDGYTMIINDVCCPDGDVYVIGATTTTTIAPAPASTTSCTSYIADSSTSCRAWAANGFCTNPFYTPAQRKAYCATTCRVC